MSDDGQVYDELRRKTLELNILMKELRDCRNELCLKCGKYENNYENHACDRCRWALGGEWERVI